jgi:hypothetical protein
MIFWAGLKDSETVQCMAPKYDFPIRWWWPFCLHRERKHSALSDYSHLRQWQCIRLHSKLRWIFKMTFAHSKNLALFVFIYKCFMSLQRWCCKREKSWHAFVAGLLGGYLVFGDESSLVNKQVRCENKEICSILKPPILSLDDTLSVFEGGCGFCPSSYETTRTAHSV